MNPFRQKGPFKPSEWITRLYGWAQTLPVIFKGGFKRFLGRAVAPFIRLDASEVPVVTSGVHNGHPLGEAELKQMVDTYNPTAQPAPIKLTHADKQGAAAGWVKSLRMGEFTPPGQTKPRKALLATLAPTEHGRAQVRSGAYLMRSIEAWPPAHPSNPTPGKWNFKALALLGNDSPACPNLGPLQLADDASEVEVPVLALGLDGESLNPGGQQPPASQGAAMELTTDQKAALDKAAETEKTNADLAKKNEELTAQLAAQTLANDTAAVKTSLDGLVKDSKLTPAQAASLAPVLLALPADGEVKLAEGKTANPREVLLAVLTEGPAHKLKDRLPVPSGSPVELAAGKGGKAKAFQALVDKHKAAGKSHPDAVAQAAKDMDADGQ